MTQNYDQEDIFDLRTTGAHWSCRVEKSYRCLGQVDPNSNSHLLYTHSVVFVAGEPVG